MTNDHHPAGRVPLPGRGEPGQYRHEDSGEWDSRDWGSGDWHRPRGARRDGIGHARRMSNWSAATLIVGTGASPVKSTANRGAASSTKLRCMDPTADDRC